VFALEIFYYLYFVTLLFTFKNYLGRFSLIITTNSTLMKLVVILNVNNGSYSVTIGGGGHVSQEGGSVLQLGSSEIAVISSLSSSFSIDIAFSKLKIF
jgi:hypothetical protein